MRIKSIKTFGSSEVFKSAITLAIAQATAFGKIQLMSWSITDWIPRGGNIPVDTSVMAFSNFTSILNSGSFGILDLLVHFDTFYAQFVQDKPSSTGSQGYMDRITPIVKDLVIQAIKQSFTTEGIEIVAIIEDD